MLHPGFVTVCEDIVVSLVLALTPFFVQCEVKMQKKTSKVAYHQGSSSRSPCPVFSFL